MKPFRIFLACCLTFASLPGAAKESSPDSRVLNQSVEIYNSLHSANRLFAFMRLGANAHDQKYLDGLMAKYKSVALPVASITAGRIYFRGLNEPIQVVNLGAKEFSFRGRRIELTAKNGIENGMQALSRVIFPKTVALSDWFLPVAHADAMDEGQMTTMLSGMLAVGGLTAVLSSMSKPNPTLAGVGGFMMGLGLVGMMSGLSQNQQAQQVTCSVDATGLHEATVVDENGYPLSTIGQYPGQPGYVISPELSDVPAPSTQFGAAQLMSMCNSPGPLSNLNTAMSQPVLKPAAAPTLLVAAPRVLPPSPVPVRPALAQPVLRTFSSVPGAVHDQSVPPLPEVAQ